MASLYEVSWKSISFIIHIQYIIFLIMHYIYNVAILTLVNLYIHYWSKFYGKFLEMLCHIPQSGCQKTSPKCPPLYSSWSSHRKYTGVVSHSLLQWMQSILREINPEYSLKRLMLKRQYFHHLMRTDNSLEKSLMLGKIKNRRRRGQQRIRWLDDITDVTDMNLGKFWQMVQDKEA